MTESYFDIDGKPIGLAELCIREPGWAANRIRAMRATIDELTALSDQPAPVEWVDGRATVGELPIVVMDQLSLGRWIAWIHDGKHDHGVISHDEATAKRIAIAVAREMQR